MDQDFARLGAELKAARLRRRPRITQPEAADALGVGRSTVQKMESPRVSQVTTTTVRAYARLLGWTEESVDRVLAGDDPTAAAEGERPLKAVPSDVGLSPEVEYELRTGRVLGSQVFNLGPDEEDGQIIVVLQGKPDATPAEVERIAARYKKARRRLQGIAAESDGVAES
ncbi:helix-turn-helix domain-containing protein [Streptomyces bauhiniae]|uniref:helix-turn-helix domain-containing protein n=1 Tax=Streptomyces bauhiniae TaxID=2340725 RepID=UPI0035E2A587